MFSIGEFSRITGISIKALRLYHEKELLRPSFVQSRTGYRYYNERDVEMARVIVRLREFGFSLSEIQTILGQYTDDQEILDYLQARREAVDAELAALRNVTASLNAIIQNEQEARRLMKQADYEVEEKNIEPMLIAGVRMRGKYSDCGQGFSRIGKKLGRYICGKPLCLYYDGEYKEEDADFEACMPVRKHVETEGVAVRELTGGRCFSLLHRGPYDQLGRSYEKILKYVKERGLEIILPTREVYLKGPGMIFKGNPRNYRTEIQLLVR
ncbi:MerR family transcriptional regulator [Candidatus Sumerlaeota bacterium]|nr:MerR family transcriptional regulator [Candidatus Sumerlaeota bacterium]